MMEGYGTIGQVIRQISDRYSTVFDRLMRINKDYNDNASDRLHYECTLPDVIIASLSLRQNDEGMIKSRIRIHLELALKTKYPQCYRQLSFISLASNQINEGIKYAMESKSSLEVHRDEPLFLHTNTEVEDFILGHATELSASFQKTGKLYLPVTESINRDITVLCKHRILNLPNYEGEEIVPFLH